MPIKLRNKQTKGEIMKETQGNNILKSRQLKIDNALDYIRECKGIIDKPTKTLLINEINIAMHSILLALPYPFDIDCLPHATQLVKDAIKESLSEKNQKPE
jgi:hypothetical protein|tara:strand:+ start:2941 stop:3243 length:303 start_codon:yes stop_codon:yes gene_type:complete